MFNAIKKIWYLLKVIKNIEVTEKNDILIEFESNVILSTKKNLVLNTGKGLGILSRSTHINPDKKEEFQKAIFSKTYPLKTINKIDNELKLEYESWKKLVKNKETENR